MVAHPVGRTPGETGRRDHRPGRAELVRRTGRPKSRPPDPAPGDLVGLVARIGIKTTGVVW